MQAFPRMAVEVVLKTQGARERILAMKGAWKDPSLPPDFLLVAATCEGTNDNTILASLGLPSPDYRAPEVYCRI